MPYELAIKQLRENWPVEKMLGCCAKVSRDLGEILQEQFPNQGVFTALSVNLDGVAPVFFARHHVTVVQEDEQRFVALDATRPAYEKGQTCWTLRAESENDLMKKLNQHYTGDWRLYQKYDPINSVFIEIK